MVSAERNWTKNENTTTPQDKRNLQSPASFMLRVLPLYGATAINMLLLGVG